MGQKFYDESDIQAIATAIRSKNGSQNTYTVSQMSAAIAAIPTQDNTTLNALIDRSITSIENSEVTSIGTNAFQSCSKLTSVSFPKVTAISAGAFQSCSNLTNVSFPNATKINSNAFNYCSNLTSVSFPKVTSISAGAFKNCSNLTNVSFPNATSIGDSAFNYCSNLTSVSFPKVTAIGTTAFQSCSKLTSVILGARAILVNSNSFNGANNAIIYVRPEDLSWYSTATNWSALYTAGRIKSIEELPT